MATRVLIGILGMAGFTSFAAHAQATQPKAALAVTGLPGESAAVVQAVAAELERAGYTVAKLDADGLCDVARLNADAVDLLVLPNAANLPAGSVPSIKAFLDAGGDIVALNAPLWQSLFIKVNGAWTTREEFERQTAGVPPEHVLFSFTSGEIASWQRGYFPPDAKAVYGSVGEGPAPALHSLHAKIEDLRSWDNLGPKELVHPFPEGHTLTIFAAKGGPATRNLAIEWQESDGSRWIATVPLTTEWRRYVLTPADFKFWESVPARSGGQFRPENAVRMNVGMAFTHTGTTPGPHEYWISAFGTAKASPEYEPLLHRAAIPPRDLLAPSYKFFEAHEAAAMRLRADQVVVTPSAFEPSGAMRCAQPRPGGGGLAKGRDWRYIPLIEASTAGGEWRGAPAAMMVHAAGPFKGGQWASFGVSDANWYASAAVTKTIGDIARKMRNGLYIIDGGANFYTYFADQGLELGVRAANLTRVDAKNLTARVLVVDGDTGAEVVKKEWPLRVDAGRDATVSDTWKPERWPKAGFKITAQLLQEGAVIDQVAHPARLWKPKEKKSFVTIKDGDFELDGKRWRAHGVNYMPSSGIGAEDGEYFERWLGARAYDPEIIERDLRHVKDIGLNAVSIFIYEPQIKDQNLLDILRICEELGLKVNLSLRPGTIGDFKWPGMQAAIEYYRLWDHDSIFAYDLDWEPLWWDHPKRQKWDGEWASWIVERYGSLENAERDWGCPAPKEANGTVTNPDMKQLHTDGEWRAMVAAYRRFLDTLLYKEYRVMRDRVHAIDPNHYASFRMTEAGDPTMNWGDVLPYDYPYLAAAVDLIEPEGYGRIGNEWEKVKPGWFEFEYARWAAPGKPMMWAEAGVSAWDIGAETSPPKQLEFEAEYYRLFYRMMIGSGADGIFWWWYPGGFRTGENSDYGIINADGSDRPCTKVIREQTKPFLEGPSAKPVDHWIEFDRDKYPGGIAGVYDATKDEFWKAIEAGQTPGLRTAGAGTNSGNCPPLAVGNTPWNGHNPPKYLDGFFDRFEIQDRQGHWIRAKKGDAVEVAGDKPVLARVTITNLGEAAWLHEGAGAVFVTATAGETLKTPLSSDTPHMGAVSLDTVTLAPAGLKAPTVVAVSLLAEGRTPFGQNYQIRLVP